MADARLLWKWDNLCKRSVVRALAFARSLRHTPSHTCTLMYPLKDDKLFVLNFLFSFFHSSILGGIYLQILVPLLLADIHMNLNVMFFSLFSGCLFYCLYTLTPCIYLQILNEAILVFSPLPHVLSLPLLFLLPPISVLPISHPGVLSYIFPFPFI